MPKTTTHPSSNSSPVSPKKQKELPTLDLPIGEEILDEEMKFAEMDLPQIDYPEIENYSDEDLKWSMTTNVWKEIQQALDEDARLDYLAERIVKDWKEHPFSKLLSYIQERAEKVDRNALFDEGESEVVTKTNEPLVLALVERLLWNIGRKHSLPDSERAELLSYRYEKIKDQKNPMEIVQAFYPKLEQEPISQAKKLEILTKVSILMMILPVPKIDEFIERNIFIDKMLQWANFKTAVDYTLANTLQFEIKNHGLSYNHRTEAFVAFLENAKKHIKNKPISAKETVWWDQNELDVLMLYQRRYETIQKWLTAMQKLGATNEQLYAAYVDLSSAKVHNLHFEAATKLRWNNYEYFCSFDSLPGQESARLETYLFLLKHRKNLPEYLQPDPSILKPNLYPSYLITELRKLGVSIKEMRDVGVTADVLYIWSFSVKNMLEYWITIKEMVDEWINPEEIAKHWINYSKQLEAGITLEEMYGKWVSLSDMYEAGIDTKTMEEELFSAYPTAVIEYIRNQFDGVGYAERKYGSFSRRIKTRVESPSEMVAQERSDFGREYVKELEKLKQIKILAWDGYLEWRALILGNMNLTMLRPRQIDSKRKSDVSDDAYSRINWMEHFDKIAKKRNKKLFRDAKEFMNVIDLYVPWKKAVLKLNIFAILLWLKIEWNFEYHDDYHAYMTWTAKDKNYYAIWTSANDAILFNEQKADIIPWNQINLEWSSIGAICYTDETTNKSTLDNYSVAMSWGDMNH